MTTTNTDKKIGKREIVKQILDRNKSYRISYFANQATKKIGRKVTVGEVATCLRRMKKEGQIYAHFNEYNANRIYGYTLLRA